MVFVSAKEGPPNYGPKEPYTVQYFDEQGNMTIKSGGTKTWRNNNVGNLKYFKKMLYFRSSQKAGGNSGISY